MGRMKKIARRTFLIGSAAIVGGVAFGIYTVRQPHENPLAKALKEGEASFNAWVRVTPDGVTLIAPHTDVGQGARSVQAVLIAEEMDLEFDQFTVEPGQPSPAYFNSALASEGLPFRGNDTGMVANSVRGIAGAAIKLLGVQVTGGSSTVPDSYEKLRLAGAVARETLKMAASRARNVPLDQLSTYAGAVVLPGGERVPYTELAGVAADITPPEEVALRSPSQWRLLGKPMQRIDTVAKATGTLDYGIDLAMDGMVNATVKYNPRQGGAMNSYDAARAESMPGVQRILEVTNGVAVVADNTWNAFQAVNAIDCDWGPAPYPAEMEDHWAEVAASFTDERFDRQWRNDGDAGSAVAESGDDLAFEYRAPYVAHAPLEPISAVARVDASRVDIWASHQMPRFAQQLVAKMLDRPTDEVHLHNQYAGGSFGHRLEFDNVRYAVEVADQLRGTPVKLTFSREEDFAHDYVRQIAMSRARGAVGDGQVRALDIQLASPSVMGSQMPRAGAPAGGPDTQMPAGVWEAPYAIEHFRCTTYRVPELAPISSWRAVGASTGGFFMESAFDELCHAAGADPLEERLRLADDPVARRVLENVADMSSWGTPLGEFRGRGVALVRSFGVLVAEVVEVTKTEQGIVIDNVWVSLDVGPVLDPDNFENQVQGGVVWGLGHAINSEITYSDGKAEQRNFHQHAGMRMKQCPVITVNALSSDSPIRGVGEPPVPPAAPALANAIFDATGERLREMPFDRFMKFA